MNLSNLFKKKPKLLSLRCQSHLLVPLSSQIRSNKEAVHSVTLWLNHPTTKMIFDMLRNESPERLNVVAKGLTELDYARVVGQIEGWNSAVQFMLSLALPENTSVEPEMTFKDE